MKADLIKSSILSVTREYTKQKKSEERGGIGRGYYYPERVYSTEVAEDILPDAYEHASGNGQYTVSKRQLYYASREKFLELTGHPISYKNFAQTVLVQYMNRHKPDWKITADPRGNFEIPNAEHEIRIPVGTIEIDRYLKDRLVDPDLDIGEFSIRWPSKEENQRFAAMLYIEKEGFGPVLKEAKIAERFDLAIMSCKGQSVVAARKLVDHICHDQGVPLFICHDFDKAGFEIASSLTSVSNSAQVNDRVAYRFRNEIQSFDLGLRLEDVEEYELQSESFPYKGKKLKTITKEEFDFLKSGRRVELNAFTAPQFVEWLESKLQHHLPERLVPTDEILERAFRRAIVVNKVNSAIRDIVDNHVDDSEIPKGLSDLVKEKMAEEPNIPWDIAIHRVIEDLSC